MGKLYNLSRLAAPKMWPIKRKGLKWIARPIPGSHNAKQAMPLVVWLKETLALAATTKNVKMLLNAGEIKINSKVAKEPNFPVGIFDIISVEKLGKYYRVLVDQNGKLRLAEIPKSESKTIPLKVTNKTTIRGGRQQISFNNGWTMFADKNFSVGDCVMFDVELKRVKSHFKPAAGHVAYVLSGGHANQTAELKSIKLEGVLRKKKLAVLSNGTETFETSLDKIFILGKEEPEIKLK